MKKVSHKKVYLQTLSLAVLGMFAFTHTASAEGLDFGLSNTLTNAGNAAASGIKTAAGQVNLTKAAVTAIKGGGTTQLKAAGGALAKAATMGAASSAINSVVGTNVMSANGSISTGGVMKAVTQSSAFKSATSNIASTLGLSPGASGTLANDASRLATAALTGNVSAVAGQMATAALNNAKKAATDYVTAKANAVKDQTIAAAKDKAKELGDKALESGKAELKNAYASYMDGKSLGDVASTFSTGLGNGLSLPSFGDSLSLGSLTSNGNLSDLGSTFSSSLGSGGFGNVASSLGGGSIGNIANTVSSSDMGKIGSSLSSLVSGGGISSLVSGGGLGGLFGGAKAPPAVWKTS